MIKRIGNLFGFKWTPAQPVPAAPAAARSGKNLDYIQALRGFASLSVVLWHASRFISPYGTGLGTQLFGAGGVLGVDLFFIISGFIMVHTTRDNDGSLVYGWNFFVKRFARIWPLYIIWTLIYVALRFGLTDYFSSEPRRLRMLQSLTFIPFSSGGSSYDYPALNVGWTINYEVYFYLIWGISLLCGRAGWLVLFWWIGFSQLIIPTLMTGDSVTLAHNNYGLQPVYLNIVCDPIVWLFVSGALIGLLGRMKITLPNNFIVWIALSASMAAAVWQYCSGFRMGHGITLWGLSLIPLFLLLTLSEGLPGMTIPRGIVYLGDISYSLYLVHPLVQEGTELVFQRIGIGAFASGFSFLIFTTVTSIGLAAVSHRYLEIGLGNRIRNALFLAHEIPTHGSIGKSRLSSTVKFLDQLRHRVTLPTNLPFLFIFLLSAMLIINRLILCF